MRGEIRKYPVTSKAGQWTFMNDYTQQQDQAIEEALTPRRRVRFEKLVVSQLVKEFTSFYRIQMFNTVVTRTRH
jgi:hypothetical protein